MPWGCAMHLSVSWDTGSADGFGYRFSFHFFYRVTAKLLL